MDYCPYIIPFESGDCRDETQIVNEAYGEKFCPECRCIEGNYVEIGNTPRSHAGCHKVTCNVDDTVTVQVGESEVICTADGGIMSVDGFAGYMECPNYAVVCGNVIPCPEGCLAHGTCLNGVCQCNPGFTGNNCGHHCHFTCASCTSVASNACQTCKGDAIFDGVSGECHCNAAYDPETGDCASDCVPGKVVVNGACEWATEPMVEIEFAGDSGMTVTTADNAIVVSSCREPYQDMFRGAFFTGDQGIEISGLVTAHTFALEIWARPILAGTLAYLPLGNGLGSNLWMSACNGLILEWGWDRVESSRDAVSFI